MRTNTLRMRQAGISLLVAALFIIFVYSCNNFFAPPIQRKAPKDAAAMGSFTLYVANAGMSDRTIMPDIVNGEFVQYKLIFTGPENKEVFRSYAGLSNEPIDLLVGTYALEVFAYTSIENRDAVPHRPAAQGTHNHIVVVAGQTVAGSVNLEAYKVGITAGGEGTFSWSIGFPAASAARIDIMPFDTNLAAYGPYSYADYSVNLPAGYYRVIITLTQANMRTVVWRETLHVYQNMTSHYSHTFTDEHFVKASFDVTFDHNFSGAASVFPVSYFYDHFDGIGNRPVPKRPGYSFRGWYTNADWKRGALWTFPQLAKNEVLYARWTESNADMSFNSNNLINVPEAERGWYAKTITGQWLRQGVMEVEGEYAEIKIPMTTQTFSHSSYANGTWYNFPHSNGVYAPLIGGVGIWRMNYMRHGNSTQGTIWVEVFIPNDGFDVWFSQNANSEDKNDRADNIIVNIVNNTGTYVWSGGGLNYKLFIKIHAKAIYKYEEDLEPYQFPYPVFHQGHFLYYWRTCDCYLEESKENEFCTITDRSHFTDNWSAPGNITIVTFVPGDHFAAAPGIKIRAYDPGDPAVIFEPDPSGLDVNYPAIIPGGPPAGHYVTDYSLPLFIDGEPAGNAALVLVGGVTQIAGNIVTRVNIQVTYNLAPEFNSSVAGIRAALGGSEFIDVTAGEGRQITFNNVTHGSLALRTEFIFYF